MLFMVSEYYHSQHAKICFGWISIYIAWSICNRQPTFIIYLWGCGYIRLCTTEVGVLLIHLRVWDMVELSNCQLRSLTKHTRKIRLGVFNRQPAVVAMSMCVGVSVCVWVWSPANNCNSHNREILQQKNVSAIPNLIFNMSFSII